MGDLMMGHGVDSGHQFLNEYSFITDAERSINCSKKFCYGLTTIVFLFECAMLTCFNALPDI